MTAPGTTEPSTVAGWCDAALASLVRLDPDVLRLAQSQLEARHRALNLVAAASPTLPAVAAAQALGFSSVTAEGYPGARYHPGTQAVDEVERLARRRAQELFGAPHANVQPLSGSAANLAVLYGVLEAGESVLSLELAHGGHLSHVSGPVSAAKRIPAAHYLVDASGMIDYGALARTVKELRPRLVICGGSAYPRALDFGMFRTIADEVDALLMADISHISGLVAAGVHQSPIGFCDVATTSTYKQLCGPRGGLILQGRAARLSASTLDKVVFPGFQGTPDFGGIAAKAVALRFAAGPGFTWAMRRVAEYARLFASAFVDRGLDVLTGGTDTHMVVVSLRRAAVSGRTVSAALERAGVLVNKNLVPHDPRTAAETSGIRLGTNDLAFRPLSVADVAELARAVAAAVAGLVDGEPDGGPSIVRMSAVAREIHSRGYLSQEGTG